MDVGGLLKGEEDVDTTAFDWSLNTDDELGYISYFMFDHLHCLVLNRKLCLEGEGWSEPSWYVLNGWSASA